jgi:hypothetical protein
MNNQEFTKRRLDEWIKRRLDEIKKECIEDKLKEFDLLVNDVCSNSFIYYRKPRTYIEFSDMINHIRRKGKELCSMIGNYCPDSSEKCPSCKSVLQEVERSIKKLGDAFMEIEEKTLNYFLKRKKEA